MTWHDDFDERDRETFHAFSRLVPGEGDLGFEWRVAPVGKMWGVGRSAAELIGGERSPLPVFGSAGDAMTWCESREAGFGSEP